MKIKMNPEVRAMGVMIKILNGTFTTRKLKFFNYINRRATKKTNLLKEGIDCQQIFIEGSGGRSMRTLVFTPVAHNSTPAPQTVGDKLPCMLWFHGGGYAIGSPEQSLGFVRQLMQAQPCVVVVPDYRLSPQAPYPAALEDAYAALSFVHKWAMEAKSPLSPQAICIGGDSAGGGLCAALSLYTRHQNALVTPIPIAFQMPLYPMIDDRMVTASAQNNRAPVWNSASNENAWKLYLGSLYGTDQVPQFAAPARATDYSFLPPTVTYVGDLEPFCDETKAYIAALQGAGVEAQIRVFEGCYHAFDQMCPTAQVSKEALKFAMEAFVHYTSNNKTKEKIDGSQTR